MIKTRPILFEFLKGEILIVEISKILGNVTLRVSSSFGFREDFFHLDWCFSKGFIPFNFGLVIFCSFWRSIVSWIGKTLILMGCLASDGDFLVGLSGVGSFSLSVLEGILLNEVFELLEYFIFNVFLHSVLILDFKFPGFAILKINFHRVQKIRWFFLWFWCDNELLCVLWLWVLLLFKFFLPKGGKIIQFSPLQRLDLLGCGLWKGFNMH